MTVISHTPNSYRPLTQQASQISCWHNHRGACSRKSSFKRAVSKSSRMLLGQINAMWLVGIPVLALIAISVMMVPRLVSLDYTITNLKLAANKLEGQNALLREQIVSSIASDQIEAWAKQNGFVKIDNVSYLDLGENNLAQVHVVSQ